MTTNASLSLPVKILLLRQKMAQQRQLIQLMIDPQLKEADPFPRSLGMKLLQQQLSATSPWLVTLKNKFQTKEATLLWSVALTLGQHWLQKKHKAEQ